MKGISPLVAASLLIAVTMTIAGILAFWASSYMRVTTTQFTNKTSILEKCTGARFDIFLESYDPDTQEHKIYLENRGMNELRIVGIYYVYPDGTIDSRNVSLTLPSTSAPQLLLVTDVLPNFQKFRIASECPDVFVEGS